MKLLLRDSSSDVLTMSSLTSSIVDNYVKSYNLCFLVPKTNLPMDLDLVVTVINIFSSSFGLSKINVDQMVQYIPLFNKCVFF